MYLKFILFILALIFLSTSLVLSAEKDGFVWQAEPGFAFMEYVAKDGYCLKEPEEFRPPSYGYMEAGSKLARLQRSYRPIILERAIANNLFQIQEKFSDNYILLFYNALLSADLLMDARPAQLNLKKSLEILNGLVSLGKSNGALYLSRAIVLMRLKRNPKRVKLDLYKALRAKTYNDYFDEMQMIAKTSGLNKFSSLRIAFANAEQLPRANFALGFQLLDKFSRSDLELNRLKQKFKLSYFKVEEIREEFAEEKIVERRPEIEKILSKHFIDIDLLPNPVVSTMHKDIIQEGLRAAYISSPRK